MNTAAREARLLETGRRIVQASPADETEVLVAEGRDFLTRFARNQIHQNVGTEEVWAVRGSEPSASPKCPSDGASYQ